jgi:hypothetical protein
MIRQETTVKTLCALIGAFFLVAGLAVLIGGPPKDSRRAGPTRFDAHDARGTADRPLLWEADAARTASSGGRAAVEAASRRR